MKNYNKTDLKYFKTLGVYKNATGTLTFNPLTSEAYSYKWWRFVAKIDGLLIFNNYFYSKTTAKHQRKIKNLLNQLNIKIDLELSLENGITYDKSLTELIEQSEHELCDKFLANELKKQEKYRRKRNIFLRKKSRLEALLDEDYQFRDYIIKDSKFFGKFNIIGVHQCVNINNPISDIENALTDFHKNGSSQIIFYV